MKIPAKFNLAGKCVPKPSLGTRGKNEVRQQYEYYFIASKAFFKTKAGFKVKDFDDITIEYASSLIRYECKRPALGKNICRSFNEAVSQLEHKIAGRDNEYGIVALSVDKIDNINKQVFRGNDINKIFKIFNNMKDNIIDGLGDNIKIASSKKIIGLHLFVSTFMWDRGIGKFIDISSHFTKRTIQERTMELYDYLFNIVREKLEAA
jgi:hypothetical protein